MPLKFSILVLLLAVSWLASAHEFWLQPYRFRIAPGDALSLRFLVGEDLKGEPWGGRPKSLRWFQQGKVSDISGKIVPGPGENVSLTLASEGVHMLVLESHNSVSKLDGEKFNAYLEEDGLDEALGLRRKNNLLNDSATELYSRHAKVLVQCGGKNDDTWKVVAGMPLEIVPLSNPYETKVGDRMQFRILYNGAPLFGALVKVFNRKDELSTRQNIYTGKDGVIEATISRRGTWLVSVVKMTPSKDPDAQWQSCWASLAFGI